MLGQATASRKDMPVIRAARTYLYDRFKGTELIVLILFGIASGGLFAFMRLTDEVMEGETHGFDDAILLAFRTATDPSVPTGPAWLAYVVRDITSLGGVTVLSLITLGTIGFLWLSRRPAVAVFVAISIAGGWLVSNVLKLGVARPRPDIVSHLVDVHDLSFPSGHAMLSAVTYLTIGALLCQTENSRAIRIYTMAVAMLLTLAIGCSRIYLGVHYPTDVLGGWCAGAVWASGCWLIGRRILKRYQTQPS